MTPSEIEPATFRLELRQVKILCLFTCYAAQGLEFLQTHYFGMRMSSSFGVTVSSVTEACFFYMTRLSRNTFLLAYNGSRSELQENGFETNSRQSTVSKIMFIIIIMQGHARKPCKPTGGVEV